MTPPTKSYDKEKPIRKTNKEKDISPPGETPPEPEKPLWVRCKECSLTVKEADIALFGKPDETQEYCSIVEHSPKREDECDDCEYKEGCKLRDVELLRPTFTTDQMKQLATAYVNGKCPVADHNRELCRVLEKQGYFKIRGRGKNGVSTYKLSDRGKAICSDPTTALKDLIKLNEDIAARKAEKASKPKPKKKNGKAPQDITTKPEIQGIAEKLCLIHFGTTYKELTDDNKRTIVPLANTYRNQGADTPEKVQQVHDHYKSCDWYEGASPFGFTKNLRIAQALKPGNGQPQATDKTFSIEEVD
jgi:hypothetical protein